MEEDCYGCRGECCGAEMEIAERREQKDECHGERARRKQKESGIFTYLPSSSLWQTFPPGCACVALSGGWFHVLRMLAGMQLEGRERKYLSPPHSPFIGPASAIGLIK